MIFLEGFKTFVIYCKPDFPFHDLDGLVVRERASIGAGGRQGIKDVSGCDNPCFEENLFFGKLVWITGSIEFFVMIAGDL